MNIVMKRQLTSNLLIWLALAFITQSAVARGQGNEVVIIPGVRASSLSGIVSDPTGAPIRDVTVESFFCGPRPFKGSSEVRVIKRIATDGQGRFHFASKMNERVCFQFTSPGFDILQMEVTVLRNRGRLHPVLSLGA